MDGTCLLWTLVIFMTWLCVGEAVPHRLNDYVLDYQPVHFDSVHLHNEHSRVRRSLESHLRWKFEAYGRKFNLKLKPAESIFAHNHELVMDNEVITNPDTSFVYEGFLEDDPQSTVHMSILDGSLSGHIRTAGETYHLEPARQHFKEARFPSIIYPESKMDLDPYRHLRKAASNSSCGSKNLFDKLDKLSEPVDMRKKTPFPNKGHDKYSAWANRPSNSRHKRALSDKKSCFMHILADYTLYKHIYDKNSQNAEKTKEEILSIFAVHVRAINDIYPQSGFKRKDVADSNIYSGINFVLQRSTINSTCTQNCIDNLDVSNFLDLTSLGNHNAFCLVHTFTYRDFIGGILGLAWVATPTSGNAGICGKFGPVRSNGVIVYKSLNTGITTMINFKQAVPSRVSQLTFAHEVGHNFGSQHDITAECAPVGTSQPGADEGNYIMFPSANSGTLPHNSKFSACSKDYIAKVLDSIQGTSGVRADCFKASQTAFCGNNVVEGNEECDCGYANDCQDKCCTPQANEGTNANACKRPSSVVCSPSEGLCCSSDCTFRTSGIVCADRTECRQPASCVGDNATCPVPEFNADYTTFCNGKTKTCFNGECVASVCRKIGWEECFLELSQTSNPKEMCYVSCRKPNTTQCISSYNTQEVEKHQVLKELLSNISDGQGNNYQLEVPPGSPCNNLKGYCDVLSKCRNIDAEGPFKQLTNLIFNPVTFTKVGDWLRDHWWADLLICIGIVVFMGVFVKIFSYHTPSSDPKKAKRAKARSQGRSDGRANDKW